MEDEAIPGAVSDEAVRGEAVGDLGREVERLRAERDALIVAADCVVGLHSSLDGDMDNEVSQDAIDRLAALLPPVAGPGAAGEGAR